MRLTMAIIACSSALLSMMGCPQTNQQVPHRTFIAWDAAHQQPEPNAQPVSLPVDTTGLPLGASTGVPIWGVLASILGVRLAGVASALLPGPAGVILSALLGGSGLANGKGHPPPLVPPQP